LKVSVGLLYVLNNSSMQGVSMNIINLKNKNNTRAISRLLGECITEAAKEMGSMRGVLTGDKRELLAKKDQVKAA